MNRACPIVTLACLLAFLATPSPSSHAAETSPEPLWAAFQNPPPEARASCYWWWKGNLSADEMGRQLRVLKQAGLGGAHIIPWESEPAYLTPEWLRLLRAAADAARQEGMLLDLSANAKWPFRGDWVSEAESLHKVTVELIPLEGPQRFALGAAHAAKPAGKAKGRKADEPASRILLAQLAPEPLTRLDQMREVTGELTQPGSPGVEVPKGKHMLYLVRLFKGVKSTAELGRVPDHFNSQAVEHYLQGFAERVAPALGGKLSNGLRALYCDSIEISEANWTPKLPEEFKRRCGYDLMPYLPLVLNIDPKDKPPVSAPGELDQTIRRVRYDYYRTLVSLFLDGLAHPFYRWCHDNGVLCRWQAYGWPWFYGIDDGYRIPDMPEGNNWLFTGDVFHRDVDMIGWPIWQKYAASGAHQAGRRITSNEAMTVVQGKFQETLDLVKRADDFNFVCGINHSFLHGFCYSPANAPFPGRDQYGTYFSEQNPWWPYLRRWLDYNARLSAVFQSSKPVAQVALLFRTADIWGQAGLHRHPFQLDPPWAHQVWRWVNQSGANADYVSDQVLQQASFEDGQISFGPMRYQALVVLGAQTLVPATAEALDRYARAGGRIVFVGAVPEASPSLQDAPANDAKVRALVQNLLRQFPQTVLRRQPPGTVPPADEAKPWLDSLNQWRQSATAEHCLAWTEQLLTDLHVQRSVQFEKPAAGLYQIHYRRDDGRDLYFFANTTQSDISAQAAFPSAGKRLERWDPETATRHAFALDRAGHARVALPPAGSLLLVASPGEALVSAGTPPPPGRVVHQAIAGPWSVEFRPANGVPFTLAPFPLSGLDQSKEERLNRFAGRAVYRTQFSWDASAGPGVHLDLGAVSNAVTEVTLNGRPLGVRWYGRQDYVVDGALTQGNNQLEVTVVTTLFNCLRKNGAEADPAGLLGPVVLWSGTKL
jgi:hypothetical protein